MYKCHGGDYTKYFFLNGEASGLLLAPNVPDDVRGPQKIKMRV